jgi:hypothetical protein
VASFPLLDNLLTVNLMQKTLIRWSVRGETTQLSGVKIVSARMLTGGRYENIESDRTPSTVLTTRWNMCWM